MSVPDNKFEITAKLWKDPEQIGKRATLRLSMVVNGPNEGDEALWVNALACSKKTQEKIEELNLRKFDVVDVEGKLLPPSIFKNRAYLTMWINSIERYTVKETVSQAEATVQEESTNEEDIPF